MSSNASSVDFDGVMQRFNEYFVDYVQNHKGPITGPGGCESVIFLDTLDQKNKNGYPDIELLQLAGSINSFPTFRANFGIDQRVYDKMFSNLDGKGHFMVFPMVLRPRSKGRIMLKSTNPMKYPLIYPNYFGNYSDIETSIRGIRLLQRLLKTDAMQKMGVKMLDRKAPGCERHLYDSDQYWECYARTFTFTIYHYSGTCKMGPSGDPNAVVNPRLKVHGFSNLRVIDASIMPEIIAGELRIIK